MRAKYINGSILNNIKKLSSGIRIVTPAEDPSGFAVAEKMKSILEQINRESMNEQDMKNYLNYMGSAISQDLTVLRRIRTLVVNASNGILNNDDRALIQSEVVQLLNEINMNASFSHFNNIKTIPHLTTVNLGLDRVNVVNNLENSFKAIDKAQDRLIKIRSIIGSKTNMLNLRIKGKSLYFVNLQSAESRLRDLDIADEITKYRVNSTIIKTSYGLILLRK